MTGTTVGHFRVVGQLGRGASGTVYRAVDEVLDREVALKVLNRDLVDPDAVARFRAEATTLARLSHPGIATVFELFESNGDLVMAMECVTGETLDQLSDRLGPLPPDRAAWLIERILSALDHAHRAAILHRDMKPANVMVDGTDVKIMDFGIARMLGAEHTVRDEGLLGTPGYMAPEQVLGHELDARTDLYAVGVMFYRLLTGTLPFDAETPMAVLQRQIAEPPPPLRAHRDDVPAWCETIVQRALAKSPTDRFQTAEEFHDALRAERVAHAAAPSAAGADRRHPLYTGLALAAAGAAAGLLVFGAVRSTRHAPATPTATTTTAPARTTAPATRITAPPAPTVEKAATPSAVPPVAVSSHLPAPRSFRPLEFETKTLVADGPTQRERNATLLLARDKISVMDAEVRRLLYSVSYDGVTSISYSYSRDPLWRSPGGPAPVAHPQGGVLRALGFSVDRRWVSLGTRTARFIVIRVDEAQVTKVLSALQERTRLTPERLADAKAKPVL